LARVQPDVSLDEARTAATLALFGVGLWVLVILARPVGAARKPLAWGMGIAFLVVLALPWSRDYFALDTPPFLIVLATFGLVVIGGFVLEGSEKAADWIWARVKGEDPAD